MYGICFAFHLVIWEQLLHCQCHALGGPWRHRLWGQTSRLLFPSRSSPLVCLQSCALKVAPFVTGLLCIPQPPSPGQSTSKPLFLSHEPIQHSLDSMYAAIIFFLAVCCSMAISIAWNAFWPAFFLEAITMLLYSSSTEMLMAASSDNPRALLVSQSLSHSCFRLSSTMSEVASGTLAAHLVIAFLPGAYTCAPASSKRELETPTVVSCSPTCRPRFGAAAFGPREVGGTSAYRLCMPPS